MNIDKAHLQDIAKKYGLDAVASEMKKRLDIPVAKLGLIGAYSSGKSSLLNALLDIHLPVASAATTKAICIVEPVAGLHGTHYFRISDDGREEVDFMTFTDIVNGDAAGDAVIQFPANGEAFEGMVFVDTPGVDSMSREEAERTCSYLELMDAALVCIPVEDGTLKKSVEEFICSPMLRPLATHLVFAVTKSDDKSEAAVENVRREIVGTLESLRADGKLPGGDMDERVVAVSEKNAKEILPPFLQKHCFSRVPALVAERERKELKSLAGDVAVILKTRADALSFDTSRYDEAIAEAKRNRAVLEADVAAKEEMLVRLKASLECRLYDTMMAYKLDIADGPDGDFRKEAISKMLENVLGEVEAFFRQHLASFSAGTHLAGGLGYSLAHAMEDVNRVRDVAISALTAVAAAWIGPSGSVAGNMGEGVFGAVLGDILRSVNPIAIVGDIIADKVKSAKFDNLIQQASWRIAGKALADLSEPYRLEVIVPLRLRLEDTERGLLAQRDARHEAAEQLREEYGEMQAEAAALSEFAEAPL